MSKLSVIERNRKKKKLILKYKNKREIIKNLLDDVTVSDQDKFNARLKLATFPRSSSPTRYRVCCAITGRFRGNYRKFSLCRHKFRELASNGKIPGIMKASW